MFNYLFVGGHFGDNVTDCRPSGYTQKLFEAMSVINPHGTLKNGGKYEELAGIMENACCFNPAPYQVILWMPDVPNDKEKLVGRIKAINPGVILVTSKNNKDGKYTFMELVARALHDKANLFVEFTKKRVFRHGCPGTAVTASVNDPLGNRFYESSDIDGVALALVLRLTELCEFTRIGSICCDEVFSMPERVPDVTEFLSLVRGYAEVFHEQIHPYNSERFLGNASFRCESGFPSFKDDAGRVFVSRRNVDKRDMGLDAFVPVALFNTVRKTQVMYWGKDKPSVDSPVHLLLYRYYLNIRYMIHSHTYIDSARINQTEYPVPCGAIEEFYEIIKVCPQRDRTFAVLNLAGHGSLVMARDVSSLSSIKYIPRQVPERW